MANDMHDDQFYFSSLISSGRIIPESIAKKYENACKRGNNCPTNKELQELTSIDLGHHLNSFISFSQLNLGKKDDFNLYEDVVKTGCLADSLIRHSLRGQYGWGLPTKESINKIVKFLVEQNNNDELIELGAGSGLWSAVLSKRISNQILSFDLDLRSDTPEAKFFQVRKEDALIYIDSTKKQNLLMVWPDPGEVPMQAIEKLSLGSTLIVCGPPFVTANADFYKSLDKEFDMVDYSSVGGFAQNDELFILKKVQPKLNYDKFFENKSNEHRIKIKFKRP